MHTLPAAESDEADRAAPASRPVRADARRNINALLEAALTVFATSGVDAQVEACAEAGPVLLANGGSPHAALGQWVNLFVDFLVTKHGLAAVLQPDSVGFDALHAYFLDRLVPVCAQLLDAAAQAGEISADSDAYELMRGIGSLCVGADNDPRYDARRMVELLIAGLLQSRST